MAEQPHRPGTVRLTEQLLRQHAYPHFGARRLASLRPSEMQAWATALVRVQGLAPGTARRVTEKVKAVFNAAVRDQLIQVSPCAGLKLAEMAVTEIVPLTPEDVQRLANGIDKQYRALVILTAASGLRPSELLGLQVKHVDWLRQTVTVAQQVQWEKGAGVVVCPPKTRRSYRVVPVPLVVTDILAQHLVGRSREPDDYLFPASEDPRKAMYREQFSRRVWRPAIKASGLPTGTRLRDLRHTYASVLIAAGKGPKTVAARLGDTVAITMAVYAHLFPNEDADTRAVISSFVESALSVPSSPVPDAA